MEALKNKNESGGSKMKCLILTITQGNGPEGGMRECESGCQFYTEKRADDIGPELEVAACHPHNKKVCLLACIPWVLIHKLGAL